MANIVRAALVQAAWTGDQETMIQKSIDLAKKAAKDGAKVPLLPGTLLRALLLPGAGERALRLRRTDP